MSESRTKRLLPWNEHTVYALGFHRRLSHLIGFWPFTCGERGSKIRFSIVVVLQLVVNYNLIRQLASSCVSLSDVLDFIGLLGTTTSSLLKILVIRVHQKKILTIVESAIKDWSIVSDDDKSREVMLSRAYIGRIIPIIQLSWTYTAVTGVIIITPPTIREYTSEYFNMSDLTEMTLRNLPMGSGCTLVGMSNFLYLTFYCFRCIQLMNLSNCMVVPDALFFAIAMHLCGQLELLKIRLTQLGRNIEEKTIRKEIVSSIRRHNHLCRHMNFAEDIFNLMILGQLASSLLHISLFGVRILFNLQIGDYMANVPWILGSMDLLCQSYIYSYGGEYLSSQATEVQLAAYSCSWYNFSPSLMKDMLLVMVRTNRPFRLTAGKVYTLNNKSYTTLLKTLFSCFSVLKLTMED